MTSAETSDPTDLHAVVVGGVAFGDRSRVVRLLTGEHGSIPLWVPNASKQKALWHPMASLEVSDLRPRKGQGLWNAGECRRADKQLQLRRDPARSAVAFFLAEVLACSLEEGAPAPEVHALALHALRWLEDEPNVPWIHVKFMAHLVDALGMMPLLPEDPTWRMDVNTGEFVPQEHAPKTALDQAVVAGMRQIPGMEFADLDRLNWNLDMRKALVLGAHRHIQSQLGKTRELKSYDVLEALFA